MKMCLFSGENNYARFRLEWNFRHIRARARAKQDTARTCCTCTCNIFYSSPYHCLIPNSFKTVCRSSRLIITRVYLLYITYTSQLINVCLHWSSSLLNRLLRENAVAPKYNEKKNRRIFPRAGRRCFSKISSIKKNII